MNARLALAALPLALWACQGELYPVAPDLPERVAVGSPAPGSTQPVVRRGNYGGQLVAASSYQLEFLGHSPKAGDYVLYLFPWDADLKPVPFLEGSTAVLKASNGKTVPMTAAPNDMDGSLFFYARPGAEFEGQTVTLQAEVTLGGQSLEASFAHP